MVDSSLLALLPLWYVAFLLSLTCHEAAHAWAAEKLGDPTAALGGQVSLNPLPHIQRELFGTVIVPILSLLIGGWMIGWASAPYNPLWQQRYPKRAAWMALAGPAANLLLVLLAAVSIHAGIATGWLTRPESLHFTQIVSPGASPASEAVALFLSILFSENLLLMAFNLIPLPPLDGATAVGLILPDEMALRMLNFLRQPGFSILGLVLAWRFFGDLFTPLFFWCGRALYGVF
ncbi:MAG: site-2 protease family protein [Acidobacteria bacterium]|nr:site-2 protease family protein [Acidobacteriota bacterium]